jgi:hypothetical protein
MQKCFHRIEVAIPSRSRFRPSSGTKKNPRFIPPPTETVAVLSWRTWYKRKANRSILATIEKKRKRGLSGYYIAMMVHIVALFGLVDLHEFYMYLEGSLPVYLYFFTKEILACLLTSFLSSCYSYSGTFTHV